jgi:hypothetical protein
MICIPSPPYSVYLKLKKKYGLTDSCGYGKEPLWPVSVQHEVSAPRRGPHSPPLLGLRLPGSSMRLATHERCGACSEGAEAAVWPLYARCCPSQTHYFIFAIAGAAGTGACLTCDARPSVLPPTAAGPACLTPFNSLVPIAATHILYTGATIYLTLSKVCGTQHVATHPTPTRMRRGGLRRPHVPLRLPGLRCWLDAAMPLCVTSTACLHVSRLPAARGSPPGGALAALGG